MRNFGQIHNFKRYLLVLNVHFVEDGAVTNHIF